MKLSAEQFAELAASFDTKQTTSNHERRRAARLDLQAEIKIRPVINGRRLDPMHVMVCNFSARGLAFIHATSMEHGRQFVTELPRKSGGKIELLCTVMHVDPVGHNAYRIGAEFTCAIQPEAPGPDNPSEMKRISESMMR